MKIMPDAVTNMQRNHADKKIQWWFRCRYVHCTEDWPSSPSPTFSTRIFAFDLDISLSPIDLASDELQIYFGRVAVRGILQYQQWDHQTHRSSTKIYSRFMNYSLTMAQRFKFRSNPASSVKYTVSPYLLFSLIFAVGEPEFNPVRICSIVIPLTFIHWVRSVMVFFTAWHAASQSESFSIIGSEFYVLCQSCILLELSSFIASKML